MIYLSRFAIEKHGKDMAVPVMIAKSSRGRIQWSPSWPSLNFCFDPCRLSAEANQSLFEPHSRIPIPRLIILLLVRGTAAGTGSGINFYYPFWRWAWRCQDEWLCSCDGQI